MGLISRVSSRTYRILQKMSYDRAITVFSPDGRLFQVEYAQEAVEKGSTAVAVRGKDCVVVGVERKAVQQLQEARTVRKICALDDHVYVAFSGLTADARKLIDQARVACQNHKLNVEDSVTVEYITTYIAQIKQKYTQSGGRRPFGLSCLLVGIDPDGTPRLYQTDPSGTYHAWKANAIGRSSKIVREFLEQQYSPENVDTDEKCTKLAARALLEVVQSSGKNLELAIMRVERDQKGKLCPKMVALTQEDTDKLVKQIEDERQAEQEKKKAKAASPSK